MPQAEIMLWSRLKALRAEGIRFRRQHAIENFVVDFACIKAMVAIEVDGQSHDDKRNQYDVSRQKRLEELGWLVLRYPNSDVLRHTDSVMQNIFECVQTRLPG